MSFSFSISFKKVVRVPSGIAYRDPALFTIFLGDLDEVLAALFGQSYGMLMRINLPSFVGVSPRSD